MLPLSPAPVTNGATAGGAPSAGAPPHARDDSAVIDARIRALVNPPGFCPTCLRAAGMPFPPDGTSRTCAPHAAEMMAENRALRERRRQMSAPLAP
jgi:hypothetical protein